MNTLSTSNGTRRVVAPVRALAESLGERVQLRYVGPLPPYSFVDEQTVPEASAWA